MQNKIIIPHGIPNLFPAVKFTDVLANRYGDETAMPFTVSLFSTQEEWLAARAPHIGASEVGTVLGLTDQWKTRRQLFDIKTGRAKDEFKGNEFTRRGQNKEPLLRALWAMEHPEFDVYDGTGMLFVSKAEPWRSCSLDFIAVKRDYEYIVIGEIKTGVWGPHWSGAQLPEAYTGQVTQQLDITQFEAVEVVARLESACAENGDSGRRGFDRDYFFLRDNPAVRDNMRFVREQVKKFWYLVQNDKYEPTLNIGF